MSDTSLQIPTLILKLEGDKHGKVFIPDLKASWGLSVQHVACSPGSDVVLQVAEEALEGNRSQLKKDGFVSLLP